MKSFEYCVPTRVVFGTDSLDRLPAQLEKSKASRVLVVYGGAKREGKAGFWIRSLRCWTAQAFPIRSLAACSRTRTWALRAKASKKPSPWTHS